MEAAEGQESAPREYQESAPAIEMANESAPRAYQEAAPVIVKLGVENATAEAKANETEAEAEPPAYQKKAPNIPGFGIWPTLSMLLTGFIIFSRKYSLR